MSSHKNIDKICIIITVLAVVFTILFMNGKKLGLTAVVDEDAESYEGSTDFTANDLNGSRDAYSATFITLSGDTATVSGSGAYTYNGSVYISNAGYYVLSGKLNDGQIVVDAYQSSKIWILLDDVDIYCSDDAAIRINQADKVFLTLGEDSVNTLESGEEYSDDALSDGAGGTIFSHDDLTINTINGTGSLYIYANYKHGIDANDSLIITGGTIQINAPQDGIHVNDSFKFTGAELTIYADDDGISAGDSFMIESGSILIDGCYEGIEALTIEIRDGDITIYPTDDGLNANGASAGFGGGMGGFGHGQTNGADASTDDSDVKDSTGLEDGEAQETWIHIYGGNLTVINDSGRDADGIDSNGDIIITGGNIRISVVNSGSNSAIDYGSESGGVCEISGGTVIACGSYSMAEAFDSSSAQCAILYIYSEGADDGTPVSLMDSDGNVLLEWDVPCSYSAISLSCPELVAGETYTVMIGDVAKTVNIEEISASYGDAADTTFGGMSGGMMNRGGDRQFGGGGFGSNDADAYTGAENFGGGFGREGGFGGGRMDFGGRGSDSNDGEMPELPDGMPAPPNGFNTEDDGMPAPPDGFNTEDGGMPAPPDGFNTEDDGMLAPPDCFNTEDGGMPTPPDGFDAEDGNMPQWPEDFDTEESNTPQGGMPDNMARGDVAYSEDDTAVTDYGASLSEYSSGTWIWLAVSAAVLAGGLIFVKIYKRHG